MSLETSMSSRKASVEVSTAEAPEASVGRGALTVLVAMWYDRPIWVETTASRQNSLESESRQHRIGDRMEGFDTGRLTPRMPV
jgi:hypothetical protein